MEVVAVVSCDPEGNAPGYVHLHDKETDLDEWYEGGVQWKHSDPLVWCTPADS